MAFPQTDIIDANSLPQTINTLPDAGRVASTESLSVTLATEDATTQSDILTELQTPVDALPPITPQATSPYTTVTGTRTTSGETSLVSATASQTTRVYRGHITAAGAVTVSLLNGSGGTVLRKWVFKAAGGFDILESPHPYAVTGANTALYFSTDAAVSVDITLDYIKS